MPLYSVRRHGSRHQPVKLAVLPGRTGPSLLRISLPGDILLNAVFDPRHKTVLVLDEDEIHLGATVDALSEIGYPAAAARSADEALLLVTERDFDIFLVSLALRRRNLDDLIKQLHELRPRVPIVLLADPSRVTDAIAMLRSGIEDYLVRPPHPFEIRVRLGRILERHELDSHVTFLEGEISKRVGSRAPVALSPTMGSVVRRIERLAPMKSTVLILGESGVGKELVARAIHFQSPRENRPFVALNCAAISENLIESELFGHEKGSFTGAFTRAPGKFEIAHRGTLFLDEIGEMKRETQAKLLRVLEEKEFMRVGGGQTVRVDVRVIAATNTDLESLVREGRFRRDLYFRLKVITIAVPPLRERREDIPELVRQFLDEICRENNLPSRRLSDGALDGFLRHPWPGNVRELKNVLENIVVGTASQVIGLEDLPSSFRDGGRDEQARTRAGATLEEMERELIRETLERIGGNRTRAARILDIGVRTLQRKIKLYGL